MSELTPVPEVYVEPVVEVPAPVVEAPAETAPEEVQPEPPEGYVNAEFDRPVSFWVGSSEFSYGAGKQLVLAEHLETIKQTHLADAVVG